MQAARLATRLQRELRMLQSDPPPGVCAWPCEDSLSHLEAQIQGPDGTVYAKGLFKLEIRVPDRYPFEPPSVRFKTPIYHPNIDNGGRICLDILNMPPKGAWKPSLNIPTVLASIGLLLAEPNPDDGLMGDITAEYKHNRLSFDMTAMKWTQQYAMQEEAATGESCSRNSIFEQKPSPSVVTVKDSTPDVFTETGNRDTRQQEVSVLQEVQRSTEVVTAATNKLGKFSVVSSSKLNLGTKLSLEKGLKEIGKQSPSADASAISSKRTLACIGNTVGTRQGAVADSQPFKKTLLEKQIGQDTDIGSEHNENSRIAGETKTPGVSNLYTDKTNSAVPSIDLEKLKRPRGASASPPSDSSAKAANQQRCYPDKGIISVTHSAVESENPEKKSKFSMFSSKPPQESRNGSIGLREKSANVEQDGPKGETCGISETCRLRIPSTWKPTDRGQCPQTSEARSSNQGSETTVQKAFAETFQRSQTLTLTSPCSTKSSMEEIPVSSQEYNSRKNLGRDRPRTDAGQSSLSADLGSNPKVEERRTAASVVSAFSHQDRDTLVTDSLLDRSGAKSRTVASSTVRSLTEPQSTSFGAEVNVVILTDESDIRGTASQVSRAVRQEVAKKPPIPVKPDSNVIVLDSESDDEPPKGRFRLSLSRRKVTKIKTKY